MIIAFQPYLERRRNLKSTTPSSSIDSQSAEPKSNVALVDSDQFRTPFDDAPESYREGFKSLWVRVHKTIGPKDFSPIDTERRLGMVSNQALYMIEGWPEGLKSFIWKKYGEGCVPHGDLVELILIIDSLAASVTPRSGDPV
ncbi:hypothetical protein LCG56_29240 (plasmid) [Pseudomonas cannabina pv. alisalensis]|uniref:Uncharacterized protein n=1 Tax=Pseudomonas syringae pv. maculicola str. ES4326 TaxID=629265 RepID=A0A8T8CA18_PSEYM|nr:hypothetical protein [Pseudomonas cannabina]QHF00476.1 hypothetical protein PMA4326_028585 [Pseudomonas syringae pv. maculicola str. ES4326]UBZ00454.1 hypothetical protein LCG56_29240 [Pseudomonas cannabina pv. alisalensis]